MFFACSVVFLIVKYAVVDIFYNLYTYFIYLFI